MAALQYDSIPEELKTHHQWTNWKVINRAGKFTKVPFQPNGYEGDSSDSRKWVSYAESVEAYNKGGFDGIGFTFDALDPYAGVDLDHCINDDGSIKPKAKAILAKLNSYSEISPSGTGIKIFLKAKNPVQIRKGDGKYQQGFESKKPDLEIEIYYANRFFTLTGNRLTDYPATIEERNEELTEIFRDVFKNRHYFDVDSNLGHGANGTAGEPLSSDAAERLQELFAADPTFKDEFYTPAPVGRRSDAEFHLCARLWEAGFDNDEIFLIMNSGPQTKWLERGDNYRWATISNAVAKAKADRVPAVKKISTEDTKGSIGFCSISGAVKQVVEMEQEDGSKAKFLSWVSDCPVHIHTETRAKDDTEFVFVGTGAVDKRSVKFTMPASSLAEPRKFKAALINAFGAKNRVGELNFEMVQRMSLNPRLMRRIETPIWSENVPLLPGINLVDNVEYRLSSKIPAEVYDGDLPAAKEVLRRLLKVHRYAPILVATILGAPAIARWRKNDRFGLGLWGLTGTLKTTTALAAMGIYGLGYVDGPKLKAGKAGSTTVGAMEIFAAAGFLPQIYDDVKTVDSKDAQNYVAAMHGVLEGEEKARGKKDGGLRNRGSFYVLPL